MKKIIPISGRVLLVMLAIVSACNKQNTTTQSASDDQILTMVSKSWSDMDKQEVLSDDQAQSLYIINDGIASDFLADESCLAEPVQGCSDEIKFIRDHSFIRCLKGLSLSESQSAIIKQDLRAYKGCTQDAVRRAKAVYNTLMEKYKSKYQRLWEALKNGEITKEEFNKLATELKTVFKKELREMQLKEKLDAAFKACLKTLFHSLHETLTERQWNAFVECYKQ
jgi:hypothetical protein